MTKPITIYWTTASYSPKHESWAFVYRKPEQVDDLNVFSFNSNIDDEFELPMYHISQAQHGETPLQEILDTKSKLALYQSNLSTKKEHARVVYNMNWLFFSEEEVEATFYLPAQSMPIPEAHLINEKIIIGKDFKIFFPEYEIPLGEANFTMKQGQAIFNMGLDTDRPVEFKQFLINNEINNLREEYSTLEQRYGFEDKDALYAAIENTNMKKTLLKEIKKQVIE